MRGRTLRLEHAVVLSALLLLPGLAAAEPLTFHLSARDALASVVRYNAFVASLGKRARGVKIEPGGTRFAGQTCAGFGAVYRLGAVTVLDGPGALRDLVLTKGGRDAAHLETVFLAAGVSRWTPPAAEAESDIRFWSAAAAPHGIRFAADALTFGSDAGLLGSETGPGVLRFRANVASAPDAIGRHRFLVELFGITSPDDSGLVVRAERRCFAFVDLEPVDVSPLAHLVNGTVGIPTLRSALQSRLSAIEVDVARRDTDAALDKLAVFTSLVVSRTPDGIAPAKARLLVSRAFHVRRGLVFSPATAVCGNGIRETGEACDGGDLGGFDDAHDGCARLGFASGTLRCGAACRFDAAGCVANPICGNGILEQGEECDRGTANSDTEPDACRTNCRNAFCGDNVIDVFEECEGRNLDGATCESEGYDGGTLRCDAEFCEIDDERCVDDEEDH